LYHTWQTETFKVATQLKILLCWHILTFARHTRAKTWTAQFDCVVDHYHALLRACPFLNDTLAQLAHYLDFPAVNVNPLLKNVVLHNLEVEQPLNLITDRVEVWTMDGVR